MYSTEPLKDITIRILNQHGRTVGAGFLIGAQRAVTCAHVVVAAGRAPGDEIQIEFFNDQRRMPCAISAENWSDPKEDDVALLLLAEESPPREIPPLRLPQDVDGHCFAALGFPDMGDYKVLHASGHLSRLVPVESQRRPLLQIEGKDIFEGMSGAAVFDTDTGDVVGMISECLPFKSGEKYAYATTAETIRSICPDQPHGPNLSIYISELVCKLEKVRSAYESWGYDIKDVLQIDQIGTQLQSVFSAIRLELKKHPGFRSRLAIEGLLQKTEEDFQKLKGALLYSVINSSNDRQSEGEIQRSLAVFTESVNRLIEFSR